MYLVSAETFYGEARKKSPPFVSAPKRKSPHSPPVSKKKKTRNRENNNIMTNGSNFVKIWDRLI